MLNSCIWRNLGIRKMYFCKVEKSEGQMAYMYAFIVDNMDSLAEYHIRFYRKRGLMDNFIKESKFGFDFASVSSHTRIVNATNYKYLHLLIAYLIGLDDWRYRKNM